MNVWILKFMPYAGMTQHALFFRTREAALKTRSEVMSIAVSYPSPIFKDDFGIELAIDPVKCAILLTDCETWAAAASAANNANRHAEKMYGLDPGMLGQMQ